MPSHQVVMHLTVHSLMMMMSAWAMCMAMFQFLFRCIANVNDLHIKVKCFACQRMIEVEGHFIAFDLGDIGNADA